MYARQQERYLYASGAVPPERERDPWPIERETRPNSWDSRQILQLESRTSGYLAATSPFSEYHEQSPPPAYQFGVTNGRSKDSYNGRPNLLPDGLDRRRQEGPYSFARHFRLPEESITVHSHSKETVPPRRWTASGFHSRTWDRASQSKGCAQSQAEGDSMDLDADASADQAPQRLCSEHKDEPLKLYCTVCKEFICYECVANGHKEDDGTPHETVPLKSTLEEHRAYIGQMATQLQEVLVPQLSNAIQHIGDVTTSLHQHAQLARRDICEHIRQQAKMLEDYWMDKVDELERHRHRILQDQRNQLQTQLSTICDVLEDCQRALMPATDSPALVLQCENVQQRLCDVEGMVIEEQARESDALFWVPRRTFDPGTLSGGALRSDAAYGPFCVATGLGTTLAVKNEEMTISLHVCDRFGQKMTSGGDLIQAFWQEQSHKREPPPNIDVLDHQDGCYTLSFTFTTQKTGVYQLRVLVNGLDVAGSPFSVNRDSWSLIPAVSTADVRLVSSRQAVSRSANQYVVGNRGFSHGVHCWKAEFQGGRLFVGVVGALQSSSSETVEDIQRRSWGWGAGMSYQGPDREPAPSVTNLDYAQVVYLTLDCSAHSFTISTQLEEGEGKQDKLLDLPEVELFPLFGMRHGGNKVLVEPI